jgi:3-hydroxy-9,10-secoandrosta-1,3,5(10)-triene-9,17-dione monooxygenase reductase component
MAFDKTAQDKVADNKLPDKTQAVNPATFRQALGQFPTGVTVVTATNGDHPVGMTANSFSSVSLDPPLVLWSLQRRAPSLPSFKAAGCFAVNVLATHQKKLCRHFSTPREDKFTDVEHRRGQNGCPLVEGAIARFECRTENIIEAGDHLIFLGRVERAMHRDGEPLIFSTGAFWVPAAHPETVEAAARA